MEEWRRIERARVVDEDIEPPEPRDGLRDEPLPLRDDADVRAQRLRPAAEGADFRRDLLRALRRGAVVDRDVRALPREGEGDCPPDPPPRARHERHAPRQFTRLLLVHMHPFRSLAPFRLSK